MSKIRMVLWSAVVVIGLVATVTYMFFPPQRPAAGQFGGAFTLEATTGGTFTEANLKGTPSLVFFGYTFCPDVCPTTLAESAAWREALGVSADQLRTIFVTVDPERDTLESMTEYLNFFGDDNIGLVGTEEQTEVAKQAFGVFSQKVEDGDETDYLVDHTASVFLIGSDGEFEGTISYGESQKVAVEKIQRLMKKS